jgi:hypothetical protein
MEKVVERIAVLAVSLLFLAIVSVAHGQVWVDPYVRKDGTQTQGHYRSNSDQNPYNNWSFPGNTNPYTGNQATGDPNRYLEQYQNRNDHGSYGTNRHPYYQYQYRW